MTDSGFQWGALGLVAMFAVPIGVRAAFGFAFRARDVSPLRLALSATIFGLTLLGTINFLVSLLTPSDPHQGHGLMLLLILVAPFLVIVLTGIGLTVGGMPRRPYISYAFAAEAITIVGCYNVAHMGSTALQRLAPDEPWLVLIPPAVVFVTTWTVVWIAARREEAKRTLAAARPRPPSRTLAE